MVVAGSLIMILFALAQRAAMRLTYGTRGPQPDDKVYFVLSTLNWLLLVGAAVPVIAVMPWWIGLLLIVLIFAAVDESLRAGRHLQRQTTVSLLALAAARGLPPAGALFRHATDQGGTVGRATRRLAHDLERGESLSRAIRRNRRAVPREAVAYAAVGEVVADHSAALAEAGRQPPTVLGGVYRLLADRVGYMALLSVFMLCVVTYIMVQVVPGFRRLFADFDLQVPAATEALITVSVYVVDNGLVVVPLLVAAILAIVAVGFFSLCGLPIFRFIGDRAMAGWHRAVVLRSLALAAERDQPLDKAIDALTKAYPSFMWRRRLRRAWKAQQAGNDWVSSLVRAKIIRTATDGLLRAGQRVGNLAWTLRTAADREETREAFRWSAGVQLVFPLFILAFAVTIGFTCYALFMPLVELINHLAPTS